MSRLASGADVVQFGRELTQSIDHKEAEILQRIPNDCLRSVYINWLARLHNEENDAGADSLDQAVLAQDKFDDPLDSMRPLAEEMRRYIRIRESFSRDFGILACLTEPLLFQSYARCKAFDQKILTNLYAFDKDKYFIR